MAKKYTVQAGDTWDAIAARELGNATLGREIAGFNGQNETGAPAEGTEILIPHQSEPAAAAATDPDAEFDRRYNERKAEEARAAARAARETAPPPSRPPAE